MDPALSRLVANPGCGDAETPCLPDRAAFIKLVSQLGFALAPHAVHAARTNGLTGLDVGVLASITAIDSDADYWQRGTEGSSRLAEDGVVRSNTDPDAWLQHYALEVRKGFGFGIETAASLGVMPNTSLISWGADARLALFEGLRHGALRYLPDTSVGIGLRRMTGSGELELGTLALDARVSHPFVVPSRFVITPWLGYQWLRIDADSASVDLTPSVNALTDCDYAGNNTPGASLDSGVPAANGAPPGVFDGSALCRAGSGADFANDASFGAAEIYRHRVLVGASYQWELLKVAAQFATDVAPPDSVQTDDATETALRCDAAGESCATSPRQWTLSFELGAAF